MELTPKPSHQSDSLIRPEIVENLHEQTKDDGEITIDRSEGADQLIEALNSKLIEGFTGNEERRCAFVDNLTLDQFKQWIGDVNKVLGGSGEYQQRQVYGESEDFGTVFDPPEVVDKEALLGESLDRMQACSSVEDKALLLGLTVNALHCFSDGNGRTSRALYFLLKQGYENDEQHHDQIRKIISEKGRSYIDINPTKILSRVLERMAVDRLAEAGDASSITFAQLNTAEHGQKDLDKWLDPTIDESKKNEINIFLKQDSYLFPTLVEWFDGDVDPYFLHDLYDEEGTPVFTGIDGGGILKILTPQSAQSLLDTYRKVKYETVIKLMDAIVDPQAHLIQDPYSMSKSDEITIKGAMKKYMKLGESLQAQD